MFDVVTLMLPIFVMIGIGAAFVRLGWFPIDGLPVLNKFVINACIPVLLFSAMTSGGGLMDFAYGNAVLFAAASLGSAFCLLIALRSFLRERWPQAAILALGGGAANSVFLGFPIASAVIPDRAAMVFSWVVLSEILFIIPIMTTIALWAEGREGHEGRVTPAQILLPLARSPVTLGLAGGFVFLASGLVLPGWADRVVASIVQAAPFIALFLIGGMLIEVRITRTGPRVLAITAAKLVIHPLFVGAAFAVVFGWDTDVTRDAILFACIPLFASYVVFCGRHNVGDVAASAIVVSTLIGAVSVTAILAYLFT